MVELVACGSPSSGPDLLDCNCSCVTNIGGGESGPILGRVCVNSGDPQAVEAACAAQCKTKEPTCLPFGCAFQTSCSFQVRGLVQPNACTDNTSTLAGGDRGLASAVATSDSKITVSSEDPPLDVKNAVINAEMTQLGSSLEFADFVGTLPDTTFKGHDVKDIQLYLTQPIRFSFVTGSYSLPIGAMKLLMTSVSDSGDRYAFDAINSTLLTGVYDQAAGLFTMNGSIQDSDDKVQVDLKLNFVFTNRPPIANAGGDHVVECNEPGQAQFHLSGAASTDPDGASDIASYGWIIDANTPVEQHLAGENVDVTLPLGLHSAELVVFDRHGGYGFQNFKITVQDTTPPQFVAVTENGAMCLWPPKHDYAVFHLGTDISALVTDVCDPNPTVQFVSATSNQPDNASGDGNTTNDVVLFPDHVCLRAERQGQVLAGRQYSLELQARDASGNTSDPTLTVVVPHDQSDHSCPALPNTSYVDDGDPECVIADAGVGTTGARDNATPGSDANEPAGGCGSAPGESLLLAMGAALLLIGRRRFSDRES